MARSSTRLLGKHAVAEGTMAFRFEKPAGFAFKPGHFGHRQASWQTAMQVGHRSVAKIASEPRP